MTLLSTESRTLARKLRGRERRNITLNTKLTPAEFAEVEQFCDARKIAFSEWVREVVLREVRGMDGESISMPLLVEVQALRLILINSLEPLLRGDTMTPEQFKSMLQHVKANKRKVASDVLASYADGGLEP
ncbi:MAG TPA: hypothetical protein VG844_14700 [Terracidiphilus sp.]|nr:hypothetical protein [Terracidiphilus sp.]